MFLRKAFPFILIAGCIALVFASCSGKKKEGTLEIKQGLAARVEDFKISEEQVVRLFEELPAAQKKEFQGKEGKAKYVDYLIDQHLLYTAALDAKVDRTEEMQERLRWATMAAVVNEYVSKKISNAVTVEPKEIEDYYEANVKEFTGAPTLRALYILTSDSLKAVKLHDRLVQGEAFAPLAKKESEDETTSIKGGDLGYFNPGGYINSIGYSEAFSKAVENLEVGQLSGIIKLDKGFAVAKVTERRPPMVKTLEQVRPLIKSKLKSKKERDAFEATLASLRKKYNVKNYVREELSKTTRTPEELWEMAQLESDPYKRIQYYRDIVNLYKNHKSAPEALFMIGFTYAEDLMLYTDAYRTFKELEQTYPESSMSESAKWMIENMQKEHPKIESIETMQQLMEEEKAQKAGSDQ